MSIRAWVARRILRFYNSRQNYTLAGIAKQRQVHIWDRLLFSVRENELTRTSIAEVPVVKIHATIPTSRTIIYLHGGGFVFGLSPVYLRHMKRLAKLCRTNVIALDYSLAPEQPYPQALEEIQRVWQQLIADGAIDPTSTVLVGDSAGGNLALASSMRWRDAALPQPACLALISPGLDATLRGESYTKKAAVDPVLTRSKLEFFSSTYAGSTPKDNPFISPVYADVSGLPPVVIHVGSEEMLLSDSQVVVQKIRESGGDVTLLQGEGMWHCWHLLASYIPEARQAMHAFAVSIDTYLSADRP